jgi:hypothetical protein
MGQEHVAHCRFAHFRRAARTPATRSLTLVWPG